MKVLATTLLFLVAVVFALCEQFKTLYPGLRWLEAFAEAALVGFLSAGTGRAIISVD